MDVLTILFAGLITHVMTDGGAQRAVLVSAAHHEPRLVVAATDVLENRGFERDANGRFRLEGERLTIDGVPKGDVSFEASYLRSVPSLTRISDGTTLLREIATGSPHEAVAAYVDLERGTLSATDIGRCSVPLSKTRSMCIASTVMFRAATTGDVVFRTASGKSLRVRPNATVQITNDPPEGTVAAHFHMYAKVMADATHVQEPAGSRSCAPKRRVATHPGIETCCSNSQYP
jgi:hypothetical protein